MYNVLLPRLAVWQSFAVWLILSDEFNWGWLWDSAHCDWKEEEEAEEEEEEEEEEESGGGGVGGGGRGGSWSRPP